MTESEDNMTTQERFNIVKQILEENDLPVCTLNIKQFDKVSELQLIAGAKDIVKKIKRYEEHIDSNNMKYPEYIMRCVRKNLDLDEIDVSRDMEIYSMSRKEIFNSVCTWNGLIGYGNKIADWVEDIYQISLND